MHIEVAEDKCNLVNFVEDWKFRNTRQYRNVILPRNEYYRVTRDSFYEKSIKERSLSRIVVTNRRAFDVNESGNAMRGTIRR